MFNKVKYYLPGVWGSILISLIFVLVGGIIGALILSMIYYPRIDISESNPILLYIIPILPPIIFILVKGFVEKQNGIFIKINSPTLKRESKLPLILLLIFLITLVLPFAIEPITGQAEMNDALKQTYKKISEGDIRCFITVVLLAPLCEEFIFRGTIERGLIYNLKSPISAIAISAFLFGAIHLNFIQAISGIIIGSFIGYIYYKTHSIWMAIFIHFINNGSSYLFVRLAPKELCDASLQEAIVYFGSSSPRLVYWSICLGGFIICLIGIYFLHRLLPKDNSFTVMQTADTQ